MNDEQARAAGLRWLAAGGPWCPRMVDGDGWTFIGLDPTNGEEHGFCSPAATDEGCRWSWPVHLEEVGTWPDFRDGATRGAALEWLRKETGNPNLSPSWLGCWRLDGVPPGARINAMTEADLYPAAAEALKEHQDTGRKATTNRGTSR